MIRRLVLPCLLALSLPSCDRPALAQAGQEAAWLASANLVRQRFGVRPFAWDGRLASAAREATRNGWTSHEYFLERVARSGWPLVETPGRRPPRVEGETLFNVSEGSFPGQPFNELMRQFLERPDWVHPKDFRDPYWTSIGVSYGGVGDDGKSFFVLCYGRPPR